MFVSSLYTGSISDKEICKRSGLSSLLRTKLQEGELLPGDSIMADKGFTIDEELRKIGLTLNIPAFLGQRSQLDADEVIQTQAIAHYRIHVERAIGKVRNFHIFDRKILLNMMGSLNQIWASCCMLANFQDPIVA